MHSIALDIHGVIDTNPVFFANLTAALTYPFWEVHVLTGSRLGNGRIEEWLIKNHIFYTHLFSIADHLRYV